MTVLFAGEGVADNSTNTVCYYNRSSSANGRGHMIGHVLDTGTAYQVIVF